MCIFIYMNYTFRIVLSNFSWFDDSVHYKSISISIRWDAEQKLGWGKVNVFEYIKKSFKKKKYNSDSIFLDPVVFHFQKKNTLNVVFNKHDSSHRDFWQNNFTIKSKLLCCLNITNYKRLNLKLSFSCWIELNWIDFVKPNWRLRIIEFIYIWSMAMNFYKFDAFELFSLQ